MSDVAGDGSGDGQAREPAWFPRAVALRRDLHAHPELRFQEHRTAGVIAQRLAAAGYEVTTGVGGTGVVATRGRSGGRHVAVRADMDALAIADEKTVAYRSRNPSAAHACGHDAHVAVAVTAAELLAAEAPRGQVTFVFQPAEEIPFGARSGARAVIESGVLDLDELDAMFGLHCWPWLPVGVVGLDESVAMAAKDAFRVVVHGRSAHAAAPSNACDALLTMSTIIGSLHHLVSRRVDPGDLAALNIGTIAGGTGQSVVPDRVEVTGTIRTVRPAVRARLKAALEAVVAGTCAGTGATYEVDWANEMPTVRNDPDLVARASALLPPELGDHAVRLLSTPPMTTDDFALFAERVPALYFKLGTCGGDPCEPLHSTRFDIDERALAVGVRALLALIREESAALVPAAGDGEATS